MNCQQLCVGYGACIRVELPLKSIQAVTTIDFLAFVLHYCIVLCHLNLSVTRVCGVFLSYSVALYFPSQASTERDVWGMRRLFLRLLCNIAVFMHMLNFGIVISLSFLEL